MEARPSSPTRCGVFLPAGVLALTASCSSLFGERGPAPEPVRAPSGVGLAARTPDEPVAPVGPAVEPTRPATESAPEEEVDAILAAGRLERAWRFMDPEQQALLVLHGVEGHSLAELEVITRLPRGTLKSRLHRARVKLGRLMQREENASAFTLRGSDDELSKHRKAAG